MQILSHDYYGQYRELEPEPIQPLSALLCGSAIFTGRISLNQIIMMIIYLNNGQKYPYFQLENFIMLKRA